MITLGTPFSGHPRATNAWRVFEVLSGQKAEDPAMMARLRKPPPVPTTSIYSRTDGIVSWRCSLNEPSAIAENIEVHASHVGMGMNPLALIDTVRGVREVTVTTVEPEPVAPLLSVAVAVAVNDPDVE